MWTCNRCETLNNDDQSICVLCGEPKNITDGEEHSSADKPRKKNHLFIFLSISVVLVVSVLAFVVIQITRLPTSQNISKSPESAVQPTATIAPQPEEKTQPVSLSQYDHQIVIDSVYLSEPIDEFRWGAAIDQTGTVWLWDQSDYIARPSDMTDAAAIYTAGVDWTARLYVIKQDGTVWWTEVIRENNALSYRLQKIQGLQNIVDLEIINSFDMGLFALDAQGNVWAFGNGKYGVFAMGADQQYYASPTAIAGLPPIQKIQCIYKEYDSGYSMVVAQATSGEFYYWGTNLFTSGSAKYSNTPAPINFAAASPNWSLFESVQELKSAYFAWLNEQGNLSIYENRMQPTDYSALGSFVYQRGGISGLYLLNESGSAYGYGYYTSGCPLTGAFMSSNQPAAAYELSFNHSIAAIAFGGWETTALYQDGRIGIWEQSDDINACITDLRFIQSESGGDFKFATSSANESAAAQSDSSIQFGDVTLTVESTCDYSVNLIPTNERLQESEAYIGGMTFDSNKVQISIDDCKLINKDGIALGTLLPGALIQLVNIDTQTKWERTQEADGLAEAFTDLPSGNYQYTVSKEGYITYTSPTFTLKYVTGAESDYVWASHSMIEEGSVFSNGFQIQFTDLAGNPIAPQKFDGISISACGNTNAPLGSMSFTILGNAIDENGMYTSDEWAPTNLFSLKKGSAAIISFDDDMIWGESGISGQCIIIRAN